MALAMAERIDPRVPTLFGAGAGAGTADGIGIEADRDDGVGGGPTLDETIVGAWEGLTAQVAVACPLCAEGVLRPLGSSPTDRAGGRRRGAIGRCDTCDAQLA